MEKNDNKLVTHTMPCVIGIQKLEVTCDVVFDLLLEVMCMCNFYYFETYKFEHNDIVVLWKLTVHYLTSCDYLRQHHLSTLEFSALSCSMINPGEGTDAYNLMCAI